MKRVSTSALLPGMVTAEEVFNYKGHLILPKGHVLTDESIDKLEFYSVINVRVEDEDENDTEEPETGSTSEIDFDDIDTTLLNRNWKDMENEQPEPELDVGLTTELPSGKKDGNLTAKPAFEEDAGLTAESAFEKEDAGLTAESTSEEEDTSLTAEPAFDGENSDLTAKPESEETDSGPGAKKAYIPQPAPMDKESYAERLRQTEEFQTFEQDYRKATDSFKESMSEVIENVENLNVDELIASTLSLLSTDKKHVSVFDMLHSMRQKDDNTYMHCMNVSLMCNILARWMKMSEEEIKIATVSGLLHDIGKLKIPEKIIKKPGRLTEWELSVARTHPREGYNILMSAPVDEHVKNAALMHHERCDGSGYPLKLTSAQIDPFAKIVAITDVYDAMTSNRAYHAPCSPFAVIAAFEKEGFQKYDPAFILTFLKNIVNTYILHRVRLTNGEEGDIIYINPDKLSKPTVRVGDKYIDLSKERHLFIDSLI